MSSSKEIISAIKTAVKRLEELAPKLIEAYENTFGSPAITITPEVQDERQQEVTTKNSHIRRPEPPQVQVEETERQVESTTPSLPIEKIDLEGLKAVNLASLATFIAKLAGREGALKLLNTFRSMGFISSEIHDKLTTLIRALPNYVSAAKLDEVWPDVIVGLINLYEKDPTNWGFLLLIRLVELIGDVHATVELE